MSSPLGANVNALVLPLVVEEPIDCVVTGGFAVDFGESSIAFDTPKPTPLATSATASTAAASARPRGRRGGVAATGGGGGAGGCTGR